jgi:hypothetical protein
LEYFDSQNNLLSLNAAKVKPADVQPNSPFGLLYRILCKTAPPLIQHVQGTYEGTNQVTYGRGGKGEQTISIIVDQNGSELNVSFLAASGGQGKGTGTLTGDTLGSISLQSTIQECPGAYEASFKFAADAVSWSYKGQDCGGPMEGHGSAKRTKS